MPICPTPGTPHLLPLLTTGLLSAFAGQGPFAADFDDGTPRWWTALLAGLVTCAGGALLAAPHHRRRALPGRTSIRDLRELISLRPANAGARGLLLTFVLACGALAPLAPGVAALLAAAFPGFKLIWALGGTITLGLSLPCGFLLVLSGMGLGTRAGSSPRRATVWATVIPIWVVVSGIAMCAVSLRSEMEPVSSTQTVEASEPDPDR